jgi:ribosome recycling factor
MISEFTQKTEQKMQKSIESLKDNFHKIRTGRAHTGVLDVIKIDYYGALTPLNQLATLSLLDAHTISVSPFDKKMSPVIEKAIRNADLGLNPVTVGELIRVPMPPLTEERRKEMAKIVKHEAETARVAIRNQRRDANQWLKDQLKQKEISEDEERRTEEEIQKLTDKFIAEIEKMVQAKEAELMSI